MRGSRRRKGFYDVFLVRRRRRGIGIHIIIGQLLRTETVDVLTISPIVVSFRSRQIIHFLEFQINRVIFLGGIRKIFYICNYICRLTIDFRNGRIL